MSIGPARSLTIAVPTGRWAAMTDGSAARPSVLGSHIEMSPALGRPIRKHGLETLGTSTQTLVEEARTDGRGDLAHELTAPSRPRSGR